MKKSIEKIFGGMTMFVAVMIVCVAAVAAKAFGWDDGSAPLVLFGTVLAADKAIQYTEGVELGFPVINADIIYAGALVSVNAAGYAVPGADSAGQIFVGVATERKDNSSGGAGDLSVAVRRRGLFKMTFATAITQANVGDNVFLVDDDSVDLAANVTNKIFCGIIAAYIDSTHAWVDIEPAIKQADVATHIADTSAAHAASAIGLTDAGNHFAAAEDTVEAALQKLAKTVTITLPRFTSWTKDGSDKTIVLPALELPVAVVVKRAYISLGTAPGTDKTLALKLNDSALTSIAGTDAAGEAESLSIAVAANTDLVIKANETAGGSGANCDIILVAQVDDGE
jgi:hypothetical protein